MSHGLENGQCRIGMKEIMTKSLWMNRGTIKGVDQRGTVPQLPGLMVGGGTRYSYNYLLIICTCAIVPYGSNRFDDDTIIFI